MSIADPFLKLLGCVSICSGALLPPWMGYAQWSRRSRGDFKWVLLTFAVSLFLILVGLLLIKGYVLRAR
jgi:hypothetical protein